MFSGCRERNGTGHSSKMYYGLESLEKISIEKGGLSASKISQA